VHVNSYGRGMHRRVSAPAPVELFKQAFRRHAAGVCVVVVHHEAGPVGATMTSVASVSADPAIVSFSAASSSRLALALDDGAQVSVYVLAAGQRQVATALARPGLGAFDASLGWDTRSDGRLVLAGAASQLHGRVAARVPAGASVLALMEVEEVVVGDPDVRPLVHHDRDYWQLGRSLNRESSGEPPAPG
jgi:flavin reductase (DIM6/NTAB) family NADH-FMN oxidoreductase RutF